MPINPRTAAVKELEKRIRLLERKLERSERNQAELEEQRRKGQVLYRKLHDDLARMQAQLIQAEKLASLGQLTAGVAHEIKNPLNFVNNFAEVNDELAAELMAEVESARVRLPKDLVDSLLALASDLKQNSEAINRYGKRADSIVKSMMDHAGSVRAEPESADVNRLVAESVEKAREQTGHPGVDLRVVLNADVPSLKIIPQEISRVVVGLINNAFDAVAGVIEPEIVVSSTRSGNDVEISVRDNGPGIPEEIRDRIFEPFFTTKPTGSGTGLGLSLAYDIVVQGHGGKLTFDSGNGTGTTFTICLPG